MSHHPIAVATAVAALAAALAPAAALAGGGAPHFAGNHGFHNNRPILCTFCGRNQFVPPPRGGLTPQGLIHR
jgi:hypothetical protein